MGFDQPGRDQASGDVDFLAVGRQCGRDRNDRAVANSDIGARRARRRADDASVAQNQVKRHSITSHSAADGGAIAPVAHAKPPTVNRDIAPARGESVAAIGAGDQLASGRRKV